MTETINIGLIRFPHLESLFDRPIDLSDGAALNVIEQEGGLSSVDAGELVAGEMPVIRYVTGRELGSSPWIAIPIFTTRRFTQWMIEVPEASEIHEPKDLLNKKVVQSYARNTDEIWTKGVLEECYGVNLDNISWFTRHQESVPGVETPEGIVNLNRRDDRDELLLSGEMDAAITSGHPNPLRPGIRYMWADPEREAAAWYKEWHFFPILHVLVVKGSVLASHPNLANELVELFEAAKNDALDKWEYGATLPSEEHKAALWSGFPFVADKFDRSFLGRDPLPYGIDNQENRDTLERLMGYALRQKTIQRFHPAEQLFAPGAI